MILPNDEPNSGEVTVVMRALLIASAALMRISIGDARRMPVDIANEALRDIAVLEEGEHRERG